MLVKAVAVATRPAAVILLLLLEYVEHLLSVHPAKPPVKQTHQATVWLAREGHIILRLIHVVKHQVDNVVTRHVGEHTVLVPQFLPRGQVAKRFVQRLMQDNKSQLLVAAILNELATIPLVAAISAGSGDVIINVGITHHQ